MAYPASYARPLTAVTDTERVDYLKKVMLLTLGGLFVSAVTGTISALAVAVVPAMQTRYASLVIILGSFAVAQYVAPRLVFGSAKILGFLMGAVFQGVAMGYLLLTAAVVSLHATGNPFLLIGEALGLTVVTTAGMTLYLWTSPKELSLVKAALSGLAIPMLLLMGISFVFPIGGVIGLGITALFVVISAIGLLYQVNQVLHKLSSNMFIEGAFLITMGILVLFWNILSLLTRLNRR